MFPVLLFADDLTGALDSAVPFATRGLAVRVVLDLAALPAALAGGPQVLAVDLATRAMTEQNAVARIEQAWDIVATTLPGLVVKKVDSRLKGPVAAECAALLRVSGRSVAVACPAVPEQGRIVLDGHLRGPGVALPIDLKDLLRDEFYHHADAANAADLTRIAAMILADPANRMAVAARGLSDALAAQLSENSAATPVVSDCPMPLILAIGSRDPITLIQVERLLAEHPGLVGTPDYPAQVVLAQAPAMPGDPATIAADLAGQVARLVRQHPACTVLCSGGETAAALMQALGVAQLIPEHELDPGIPLSRVEGWPSLRLITKSGGFGAPDALSRIVTTLLPVSTQAAA